MLEKRYGYMKEMLVDDMRDIDTRRKNHITQMIRIHQFYFQEQGKTLLFSPVLRLV